MLALVIESQNEWQGTHNYHAPQRSAELQGPLVLDLLKTGAAVRPLQRNVRWRIMASAKLT